MAQENHPGATRQPHSRQVVHPPTSIQAKLRQAHIGNFPGIAPRKSSVGQFLIPGKHGAWDEQSDCSATPNCLDQRACSGRVRGESISSHCIQLDSTLKLFE